MLLAQKSRTTRNMQCKQILKPQFNKQESFLSFPKKMHILLIYNNFVKEKQIKIISKLGKINPNTKIWLTDFFKQNICYCYPIAALWLLTCSWQEKGLALRMKYNLKSFQYLEWPAYAQDIMFDKIPSIIRFSIKNRSFSCLLTDPDGFLLCTPSITVHLLLFGQELRFLYPLQSLHLHWWTWPIPSS